MFAYSSNLLNFAAIGILLGLWSCTGATQQVSGLTQGPSSWGHNPEVLVRTLSKRADQLRSLRSLAKVYYWTKEDKGGFQGAVLVQRPDRLRIETLSLWGAILIVTADPKEVVGFNIREGLFYRGKSSKKNLLRFTQVPLELGDLTSLLMGLPPVDFQRPWRQVGNSVHWQLSEGRSEVVSFDPAIENLIRWKRLNHEGETEISATFSKFYPTLAGKFPLKILLETEIPERRFEIIYRKPELNLSLPLTLFVQKRPDNIQEVSLDLVGG